MREVSPNDESQPARAVSAGGVILRQTERGYETVLVGRKSDGAWLLPKGTPNEGEPIERTALREVAEETGLEVKLRAPLGSIYYSFARDGRRIDKTVLFYLMSAVGGSVERHDHEYDEVRWVHVEEAKRLLSHDNYREILDRALREHQRLGLG